MASLMDRLTQGPQQTASPVGADAQAQATAAKKAASGRATSGSRGQSTIRQGTAQQQVKAAGFQQTLAERIQAAQLGTQAAGIDQQAQLGQEQLAAQGQMAQQEMATRGVQAGEALAGQQQLAGINREASEEMKNQQIESQSLLQLQNMSSKYNTNVNDIFAAFDRSTQELEFRKDAAELEQIAFSLAMADKAYLDELSRTGQERRLDDQQKFQEELARIMLGEKTTEFLKQIGFQEEVGEKKRDWNEELAAMGSNNRMDLAKMMLDEANERAMWEAGGTIASSVISSAWSSGGDGASAGVDNSLGAGSNHVATSASTPTTGVKPF